MAVEQIKEYEAALVRYLRDLPSEGLKQIRETKLLEDDTASKLRLRDAYVGAGWAEPRIANLAEEARLGVFIRNERIRVYAKAAEQCETDGDRHAAIILRRAVAELAGGQRAKQPVSQND